MKNKLNFIIILLLSILSSSCHEKAEGPQHTPPGAPKETSTQVLEAGAVAIQDFTPIKQIDLYLDAFHPMKNNFSHQMEAHHYCQQLSEEFTQCIIYDGNTKRARMTGIEYIISENIFNSLPTKEKRYWHPHNYEILSGQLIAPGLPDEVEKQALKKKLNSYGKTWHVWMTNKQGNKAEDSLPLGCARLAWSFTKDNQVNPALLSERDKRFNISTSQKEKERMELKTFAHPQVSGEH